MAAIVAAGIGFVVVVATIIARSADEARTNEQIESVVVALNEHRALFADATNRLAANIAALPRAPGSDRTLSRSRMLWPEGASALRHDRAYLINGRGLVEVEFPQRFDGMRATPEPIRAFLRRVVPASSTNSDVNLTWSQSASGEAGAAASTDFLLVDGKPMIAAAAPVHPSDEGRMRATRETLVLLDQIDLRAISLIARIHNLEGMDFETLPPAAGRAGLPLISSNGDRVGWLNWNRTNAVSTAFWKASPYFLALSLVLVCIAAITGAMVDRSNRRLIARERLARYEAAHDALTGLANRTAFGERLSEQLQQSVSRNVSILYMDLDGFKEINDTLGHHAGDELLVAVAQRLKETVRDEGLVARLGGDEFAVMLPGMGIDAAVLLARRVIAAVQRVMVLQGATLSIGASIGIASAPLHGNGTIELVRRADIALYAAKRRGRGQAVLFDREMEVDVRHRRYLERDMRAALLTGEFQLAYQPIVAADGQQTLGVEALLRWKSISRGMVSPADFIPVAEETGFIIKLGAWALQRACIEAVALDIRFVSVNLSPVQMRSKDIVAVVADALKTSGLPPERLVLEITEGVLIDRAHEALAIIRELQGLGVSLALDDFGTGYSSLAYLTRFPFNKLKMDRAFVDTLGRDSDAATIVHAIISLGRALGMTVVAEGVETREQHRFLRAAGCHEMQGYLFAKPMPLPELQSFLEQPSPSRLSA